MKVVSNYRSKSTREEDGRLQETTVGPSLHRSLSSVFLAGVQTGLGFSRGFPLIHGNRFFPEHGYLRPMSRLSSSHRSLQDTNSSNSNSTRLYQDNYQLFIWSMVLRKEPRVSILGLYPSTSCRFFNSNFSRTCPHIRLSSSFLAPQQRWWDRYLFYTCANTISFTAQSHIVRSMHDRCMPIWF